MGGHHELHLSPPPLLLSAGTLPSADGEPAIGSESSLAKLPVRMGQGYALQRLALARVVLDAGFAGDAVKASYEALAAAIGGLLSETPAGHAQLVAAIFSTLLPGGCLPSGAHGSLAKLHDLSLLEAHGVAIDAASASAAVTEASEWVDRIGASPSSGSLDVALATPNA